MVSVIIPAFDEACTVAGSVGAARRHPEVDEVIVVDDGSTDATAQVASRAGGRVIRLARNAGKAAALQAGVLAARNDHLLFLDADVHGHTDETLSRIMRPVVDGRFEMYVGIHARGPWFDRLRRFCPILGGERALTRRLWDAVPAVHKSRFQIEIAMNHSARMFQRGMGSEVIDGTTHFVKEQKYGFWLGSWRRQCMVADIVRIGIRLYGVETLVRLATGVGFTSIHSQRERDVASREHT